MTITTAPADTARAMHAAEMRGQDMQGASLELSERLADLHARRLESAHGYSAAISAIVEAYRSKQLITEAECQRRIDAAVQAEREAAKSLVWTLGHEIKAAMLVDEDNERTVLDMVKATAAAIRARGQK